MGAVRNDNFYVVQGWMINIMGLKGSELQLYAIIYGFSQTGGQEFKASLQYLADWTGLTRQNVLRRLQSLVEKGFLQKEDEYTKGVKGCKYRCTITSEDVENYARLMDNLPRRPVAETATGALSKQQRGVVETATGRYQNSNDGVIKTATNNISNKYIDIDIDNKDNNAGAPAPAPAPEKPKKKKAAAKVDTEEILHRYTNDAHILELLREWLKVRKAKRSPETEKALTLNLDKLARLANESNMSVAGYLEAVISRGWAAFFPIKEYQGAPRHEAARSRVKTEAEHKAGQDASGFGW